MRGTKGLLGGVGLLLLVVAVAGEARAQGLDYVGPFGLFHTNGNKVVVGSGNVLHMVYQESGASACGALSCVQYTTSADGGVTWVVPPFTVSPNIPNIHYIHPTIAVNGTTVAIAWVQQTQADQTGTLFYRVRNGTTWSIVTQVSCTGCAAYKPSMVNLGTNIHLAWSFTSGVQYATFPITQPPSQPLNLDPAGDVTKTIFGGLCGKRYEFHDVSVAVAPPCVISPPRFEAVSTPEVVQVAATFVEDDRFGTCYPAQDPYILGSGVFVFRRDPANAVLPWPLPVYGNERNLCFDPLGMGRPYPLTGSGTACNMFRPCPSCPACSTPNPTAPPDARTISASLSAARALNTSGDFFLGWSDGFDSGTSPPMTCTGAPPPVADAPSNRTMLTRMRGDTLTKDWMPAYRLDTKRGNVDVINRLPPPGSTPQNFRVAWSQEVVPLSYGRVPFCSGNWTGTATAPTIGTLEQPCAIDIGPDEGHMGRDPQVLYYRTSGTQTRAMFDRKVSVSPASFKLTPYREVAADTAIYQFGLCDNLVHPHTFLVTNQTLVPLGDLIADDRIAAPIRVSLFSKLEAADAALAAGRPATAARQLGALAHEVAAQGGRAIPAEVAADAARAIDQLVAALTGAPAP